MWEQITSNQVKSGFLVGFFVLFVVLLGWLFGRTTAWGPAAPVLAAVIAGVTAFASYYNSDKMVLAISRARPAHHDEFPYLHNTVEGLSIAAGQINAYVRGVGGEPSLAAFFALFTIVGAIAMGLYLKYFGRAESENLPSIT